MSSNSWSWAVYPTSHRWRWRVEVYTPQGARRWWNSYGTQQRAETAASRYVAAQVRKSTPVARGARDAH